MGRGMSIMKGSADISLDLCRKGAGFGSEGGFVIEGGRLHIG